MMQEWADFLDQLKAAGEPVAGVGGSGSVVPHVM